VRELHLGGDPASVRVRFPSARAVRITHAVAGAQGFPPDRPWLQHVWTAGESLAPERAELRVALRGGHVAISTLAGETVLEEAAPPRFGRDADRPGRTLVVDVPATELRVEDDRAPDAVSLRLRILPGEGFYGFGERFDAFRRERGCVRMRIRDAIASLQSRETYSALPVFVSSRGYLFWLLNSHPSRFEISPERGELRIDAAGPNADYVVVHGPDLHSLIASWTELTGRPPLVPRWALGLAATGYPQEPQEVVLERVREHRRRSLPLDAVILDYHWEARFHDFRWRASLFPDPDGFIAALRSHGVRLGLILTPFANHATRPFQRWLLRRLAANVPPGCERDDERAPAQYAEGLAKGYFAHPDAPWWFGRGGIVDFTHSEAAAWFASQLRPLYAQGVAFFKNDDGEYLPDDATSALGMSGREHHNLYGFYYGRALHSQMEALDDRRGFLLARSVWVGSQRFPALFLGDQKPTFRHMRSALRAGLGLGLLGFAHWTVDVFGLDGRTTPETHRRYAQWALFAPIARTFWRPPDLDGTRFPWSHGPDNEEQFRTHAELRYRLLPYLYALAWEAWRTGLPVLRPMLLEFDDPRFADVDDQAMLGDRLLLAPILDAGRTGRRIALPEGVWHDFWSARSFAGGSDVDYAEPRDRLPLLARGGTLLPLGPRLEHVPERHRFDRLELHAWPPWPAEAVLYDDDGWSRAYQRGEFATTRFAIHGGPCDAIVSVEADVGSYAGQPDARELELVLHQTAAPRSVWRDGADWRDWRHDPRTACVHVRFTAPTRRESRIELRF